MEIIQLKYTGKHQPKGIYNVRADKVKICLESGLYERLNVVTKEELFDLNKDEQIEKLNEFKVKKIPKYENDRVELLYSLINN